MEKEILFEMKSPYRDDLRVTGYKFGSGEKSLCIVGGCRGNEIQQIYICSQLIKILTELEKHGSISKDHEILVVPSINHYSINVGKRFWPVDNTDINRMYPGYDKGETTQRIAAGVFSRVQDYSYGIQFPSSYIGGGYMAHVRMMATGYQNASLANLFGLPYVVVRSPRPFDTTTLNYNWQVWGVNAFSIYTKETENIDLESAHTAVCAVLRFMSRMGMIHYGIHAGYASAIIKEDKLIRVKTKKSGLYMPLKQVGCEVAAGEVIGHVLHPYEGTVTEEIKAPENGMIFFAHTQSTVMENTIAFMLVKNSYE